MTTETILTDDQIDHIIEDVAWPNEEVFNFGREVSRAIEQAVLQSTEIQEMWDALNQCRFALEPYDDVKPRDWKTDRENLRYAHRVVCAAIAKALGEEE